MTPAGRLARAGLATAVAVVLLTGTGATSARWVDSAELEPGVVGSGRADLTHGPTRVELHSRQPTGSRTYASGATCTPATGYTECRVISSTVAQEALVAGDRVVVTDRATFAAVGDNLVGEMVVSAGPLTSAALSTLSGTATTTTTITPPSGIAVTGTGATFPVSTSTGRGIGTYTARTVISTSTSDEGLAWGTRLWGQRLYSGSHSYGFTQTREPG